MAGQSRSAMAATDLISPSAKHFAVDDVMVVLEGGLSVSTDLGTVTAGPGDIVYMPKGTVVTIRSGEKGAVTAYVTYPHWQEHLS